MRGLWSEINESIDEWKDIGLYVLISFFSVQCAVENCVSDGQSVLNRTVRCTAERNASYVSDDLCDVTAKPPVTQKCPNSLCRPVWNTSQWSDVSKYNINSVYLVQERIDMRS